MLACLFFCDSSSQNRAGLDQTSFFAGSRCARPGYDLTYSLCLPNRAPLLSFSSTSTSSIRCLSLNEPSSLHLLLSCFYWLQRHDHDDGDDDDLLHLLRVPNWANARASLVRSNKSDLSKHSTRRLGDRLVSPICVPFCPPRRDLHPSLSLLPIVDNLIDRPIALSLLLVACGWALLENVSRMSNRTELIETRNQLKAMR